MKILTADQIRKTDEHTILNEPIQSIDLMERASKKFVEWYTALYGTEHPIIVLCGKGNNGGDGLAISRLLVDLQYDISVIIVESNKVSSENYNTNLERIQQYHQLNKVHLKHVHKVEELNDFADNAILIDAILGSGLSRGVEGDMLDIIQFLNQQDNTVIAVDIPTGLFSDTPTKGISVKANKTFSFEAPKLAFFFPENYQYVGEFYFESIGLDPSYIEGVPSSYFFTTESDVKKMYKKREKFAHKGNFGHSLLIMGSYGKLGAAILATQACLRAGVGLVTVHIPECGFEVLQNSVPEAMVSLDEDRYIVTKVEEIEKYSTIAIGCGLSTKNKTRNALCYLLKQLDSSLVLDADALNILGQSKDWLELIPQGSILTPHAKEFERMFGSTKNNFERNELQRKKARELGVYIILKGANTCIATPEGNCYFNSTGNPGMGTAGSGDVLTGILSALLSQHYTPFEACVFGVYLHGLAGDIAADTLSEESLIAGDIVKYLGAAFKKISS